MALLPVSGALCYCAGPSDSTYEHEGHTASGPLGLFTGNDWNTGRNEGNVNNNRGVSGP